MHAYKFLAEGAVGPFTAFAWPVPGSSAPGAWVDARPGDPLDRGIFALRARDLPFWIERELWRVELAEPVRVADHQVAAARARLVARVAAWDAAAALAYARACAFRTRDVAAEGLRAAGLVAEADRLLASDDLRLLELVARDVNAGERAGTPRGLAGFVVEACLFGLHGGAGEAGFILENVAAACSGGPRADAERLWQAGWLARHLALEEPA